MSLDAEALELMPHTIKVQAALTDANGGALRDEYGARVFGPGSDYPALVTDQQKLVRTGAGQERLTVGMVYTTAVVGPEDRVTLPDGRQPPILVANSYPDETGDNYVTEVGFG